MGTLRVVSGLLAVLVAQVQPAQAQTNVDVAVVSIPAEHDFPTLVALQACAGLLNRQPGVSGAAYLLWQSVDQDWLNNAKQDGWIGTATDKSAPDFLRDCMRSPAVKGYIRYNYTSQHLILPQILTLAGVLDAVPLQVGTPTNASLVFDAMEVFGDNTTLREATQYLFERKDVLNATSTLAFMDPGFDGSSDPFAPKLTRDPNPSLIDLIVKRRLFNMYMVEACIPDTEDYTLMESIATNNPWPRPIAVWGYNDAFDVAGDLFEAETTCVKAHNMGQVATDSARNLAFFSIQDPITQPMTQNPTSTPTFNASRTYLALTVGDGDNIAYLQNTRRSWMQQRVSACQQQHASDRCYPLLWSVSPHTLSTAPGWLQWFYRQAALTGADWFVLPPSGHLYAYPSEMPPQDQAAFVQQTEADAKLLATNAAVAWEFAGSWQHAIDSYFPRYSANNVVRSFFAVNVPFMLPVLPFLDGEFFKVLNESVVLFKPREWRGTNASQAPPLSDREYLTAEQMAAEINAYPSGTVTQIYVTSDGGADLSTIDSLIPKLAEHVELVDHEGLLAMALQSHAAKGSEQG